MKSLILFRARQLLIVLAIGVALHVMLRSAITGQYLITVATGLAATVLAVLGVRLTLAKEAGK